MCERGLMIQISNTSKSNSFFPQLFSCEGNLLYSLHRLINSTISSDMLLIFLFYTKLLNCSKQKAFLRKIEEIKKVRVSSILSLERNQHIPCALIIIVTLLNFNTQCFSLLGILGQWLHRSIITCRYTDSKAFYFPF